MKTIKLLTLISFSSFFLFACQADNFCTDDLRWFTVQVQFENGDPLTDASYEVVNTSQDNTVLTKLDLAESEMLNGRYVVVSSTNVSNEEVLDRDILELRISYGDNSITEEYRVTVDSNQCHFEEVEGPEVLVVD